MRRSGLASLNPTLHKLRNLAPGCVLEALALALDALVAAFPRWALGAASKPRAGRSCATQPQICKMGATRKVTEKGSRGVQRCSRWRLPAVQPLGLPPGAALTGWRREPPPGLRLREPR